MPPCPIPEDTVAVDITEVLKISDTILKDVKNVAQLEQFEAKWHPIITPPYKHLWLELTDILWVRNSRSGNAGYLLLTEEIEPSRSHEFKAQLGIETIKWQTTIAAVLDLGVFGILGAPAIMTLYIHANGKIAPHVFKLTRSPHATMSESELESEMDDFLPPKIRFVLLHALALMHCKNISTIDQPLPRQQTRQLKRKNIVPIVVKTLAIRPLRRIEQSTPGFNKLTRLMRHHLVRGHFKTFTEDAPLFGKLVGTYWWESAVRGTKERGEIKKDYKIYPEPPDNVR